MVTKVEKRKRRKRPAAPFTTSTLQQEAAKKLGFSSRRTMRAAQDLYEGMEIGEDGPVGLITYMRTDSVRVSDAAIAARPRDFIKKNYAKAYLPGDAERVHLQEERRVQDAHEASPAHRRPPPPGGRAEVPRAGPVPALPAHLAAVRGVADDAGRLRHDHRGLRPRRLPVPGDGLGDDLRRLPRCSTPKAARRRRGRAWTTCRPSRRSRWASAWRCRSITPSQHFTEPPPRFSEASLVKELERLGIGRPSTYAPIISTLYRARVRQAGAAPLLSRPSSARRWRRSWWTSSPTIFNVEFTSEMETELDKIEEGELGWQRVLRDFYGPFAKALEAVDLNAIVAEAHGLSPEELGQGALSQVRRAGRAPTGRFGPYLACVNYKTDLRLREVAQEGPSAPDRPTDEKCQLCDAPMVIKTGRFGEFLACTRYPECKGTRVVPLGMKCPKCARGRSGRATDQAGQVLLGLHPLPRLRLLHLEPSGTRHVPGAAVGSAWRRRSTRRKVRRRTCLKCGHKLVVAEPEEVGDVAQPERLTVRCTATQPRGNLAGVTVVGGGLAGR